MTRMTARFRRLGLSIADFTCSWDGHIPSVTDDTLDIALGLVMAWAALQRLLDKGIDTSLGNRRLIAPYLERAWREMLYLRSRQVDLDESLLTRYGKLVKRQG